MDGVFVSTSEFALVMPAREAEVSLGVDEGVAVEYRYPGRFKKNEGLVNKKVSEQFEYQIRITNNCSRAVEITVYEQFPISEEKEITVKRIAPLIKENIKDNQSEVSLDDELKIEWKLTLSPAEKRELPCSFLVEYPVGSRLQGI